MDHTNDIPDNRPYSEQVFDKLPNSVREMTNNFISTPSGQYFSQKHYKGDWMRASDVLIADFRNLNALAEKNLQITADYRFLLSEYLLPAFMDHSTYILVMHNLERER